MSTFSGVCLIFLVLAILGEIRWRINISELPDHKELVLYLLKSEMASSMYDQMAEQIDLWPIAHCIYLFVWPIQEIKRLFIGPGPLELMKQNYEIKVVEGDWGFFSATIVQFPNVRANGRTEQEARINIRGELFVEINRRFDSGEDIPLI